MCFFQTDSLVSPWEMHYSPKVKDDYRPSGAAKEAEITAESTPADVLALVDKLDCAAMFSVPVRRKQCPRYFEVVKRPLFMHDIRRRVRRGEFAGTAHLLDDLQVMAANAKLFNQPERIEFRLGDELESFVGRMRGRIGLPR